MTLIQEQCPVRVTLPVVISEPDLLNDYLALSVLCGLIESKLIQLLRFAYGETYSVSVGPFFGLSSPKETAHLNGSVKVSFSCDPSRAQALVQMTFDEIQRLQEEGPSEVGTQRNVNDLLTYRECATDVGKSVYR